MKTIRLTEVKSLKNTQIWLLGIAAGLIAIILTLTWKSGDVAQVGMSMLFLLAIASLIGDKRHNLNLESGIFASVLGGLLIAFVLWQSASFNYFHKNNYLLQNFIRISPFLTGIALGLIASGFKGLKQYWQELTILFFLGVPYIVLSKWFNISFLTAKFSAFLLWYSGFEVSLQGLFINLPTGSVKVSGGCSGIEAICYLLGIAVICLLTFPIEKKKVIFIPFLAVTLAFIINGIRVALLTILVAKRQLQAFDYWHEGDGSLLFGMIEVVIFGLFYLFLLRREEQKNKVTAEWKK